MAPTSSRGPETRPASGEDPDRGSEGGDRRLQLPGLPQPTREVVEDGRTGASAGRRDERWLASGPRSRRSRPRARGSRNPSASSWKSSTASFGGGATTFGGTIRPASSSWIDDYVHERLALVDSKKRQKRGRRWGRMHTQAWFARLGIFTLSGTVRYIRIATATT